MNMRTQGTAFLLLALILGTIGACAQPREWRIDSAQTLQDLKLLASDSLQGRATGTEGGKMARMYVKNRMVAMGLTAYVPDYFQNFKAITPEGDSLAATNVIGFVPGTSKGPALVISAHYDHLGIHEGEIFNGADDNASGVAAMLAIAEYYTRNQPEHSILFVAFDAEEMGLQGARYFVKSLVAEADSLVFNLNLDMVSRSYERRLYASGTYHSPYLKPWLESVKDSTQWGVELRFGHDRPRGHLEDWTFSSDHAAFHHAGIPFLYMGVEDHNDYHKATDVFWTIDQDFYLSVVELILETSLILDEALPDIAQMQRSEE